ncbi:MAG: O-antigen ligase family protein [Clostridia bacterium]|nr:O-antigen ligase family protein [Clostridia bacterium]
MKISAKKLIYILLMLYPILPVNHYIGALNYANIASILIVGLYLVFVKNKKIINIFKFNLPFWMYLIVYALFAIFTSDILTGIAWLFSTVFVNLIILDLIRNKKDFNLMLDLIIISSFILSLIGIFEAFSSTYLIQSQLLSVAQNIRYGILRATGPFGICINFGLYQAICAILIFYKITIEKNVSKVIKYKCIYILVVISLFLSVSRLAICLFIAAQVLLYVRLGINKALKKLMIIICFIPIIIIIFEVIGLSVFDLFSDFFVSFFELIGVSVKTETTDVIGFGNRTDLYAWVWNAMNGKFLFGMGVDAEFQFKMTTFFTKTSIEVHYLNILYHMGFVGLITLIISYISTLKLLWKNKEVKMEHEEIPFTKLLLVILSLYFICLFGVQETDLTRFYCELIVLAIAYIRINKDFDVKEKK